MQSKRLTLFYIFAGCSGEVQEAMLTAVWILFARTLLGYTHIFLVVLIITRQVVRTLSLLFISYLCDKFGFDRSLCATSLIVVIGMLVACTSYSMTQFAAAVLLEAMAGYEVEIICSAFGAKFLPFSASTIYYGYRASSGALGVIGGVVLAGIIASYTTGSYRNVLYCALAFSSARCALVWWKIRGTQSQLAQRQLSFVELYGQPDAYSSDDKFPLCLERGYELELEAAGADSRTTYFGIFSSPSLRDKSGWYAFDLYLHILLGNLSNVYGVAFVTWLYIFIIDRFDTTLIIPAVMVCVGGIVFAVVATLLSKLAPAWSLMRTYVTWMLTSLLQLAVLLLGFVWNVNDSYGYQLFWLWVPLVAINWAVGMVLSQVIILEQQPKRDTGKIMAIKIAGKYLYGGIVSSLIAVYWAGDKYYCFGIIFAVVDVIAILLLCAMLFVKLCKYGPAFQVTSVK